MRTTIIVLAGALAFGGCGGDEEESTEESTETPEAVTPTEVTEDTAEAEVADGPSYSLHEWGLLDVDLGEAEVEYAAGPGRVEAGSTATAAAGGTQRPSAGGGSGTTTGGDADDRTDEAVNTANSLLGAANEATGGALPIQVQRRKPVVYFHLTDPAQPMTVNLTVNLGTGNLVEHFPAGQVAAHGVTWTGVAIGGESCQGGPYPVADGPACAAVSDGYCEAAELAGYVANDAGCLTLGGAQSNFLFYRGAGPAPTLPVTIARSEDGTVRVTNDSMAEPVGPMLRFRRGDDGAIQVAQVSTPAQGASIAVGIPADAASDAHRELIREQLTEIGLTPGEAQAFENAWFGELFDGEAPTPHAFSDAILFFLPADSVDGFAHLEPTPAPAATVRAMAVRAGWR